MHDSAGISRSGVFIALDWLLQELQIDDTMNNEDPVVQVIDRLRDQQASYAGAVEAAVCLSLRRNVLREQWRNRWILAYPEEASRLDFSRGTVSV